MSLLDKLRNIGQTNRTLNVGYDQVAIGHILLDIPPINISVSEIKSGEAYSSLRSSSESLIKTGKGDMSVSMNVVFNNPDSINNKLRPLLALFRGCPFITITNEYLADTVHRRFVDNMDSERERQLEEQLDRVMGLAKDEISKLHGIIDNNEKIINALKSTPPLIPPDEKAVLPVPTTGYTVTYVEDGDTIIAVNNDTSEEETLRFIGVDTPETVDDRTFVEFFGPEASTYMKGLVSSGDIIYIYYGTAGKKTDVYDRTLAYLYKEVGGKYISLNEELIRNGFSDAVTAFGGHEFLTEYLALAEDAKSSKRGIWSVSDDIVKTIEAGRALTFYFTDWLSTENQSNTSRVSKLKDMTGFMSKAKMNTYMVLISNLLSETERKDKDLYGIERKLKGYYSLIMNNVSVLRNIKFLREFKESNIVPVLFHSITYGPTTGSKGTVKDSITAQMTFKVFNYAPFSADFSFLDIEGNPTPDIGQCYYLIDYLDSKYLNNASHLGNIPENFDRFGDHPFADYISEDTDKLAFRFPTTQLLQVDMDPTTDTKLNPVRHITITENEHLFPSKFTSPLIEYPEAGFITMWEDLVFGPNSGLYLENIAIQLTNNVAFIPLQGSNLGTYQHVSGPSVRMSISLSINSEDDAKYQEIIRKMRYMQLESNAVALKFNRMRKDHKIFVFQPLINIAGIYAVQLQNIRFSTPSKEARNTTNLTMEMIEFRVSQEAQEIIKSDKAISIKEVKKALEKAYEIIMDPSKKTTINESRTSDSHNLQRKLLGEAHSREFDTEHAIYALLFGEQASSFTSSIDELREVIRTTIDTVLVRVKNSRCISKDYNRYNVEARRKIVPASAAILDQADTMQKALESADISAIDYRFFNEPYVRSLLNKQALIPSFNNAETVAKLIIIKVLGLNEESDANKKPYALLIDVFNKDSNFKNDLLNKLSNYIKENYTDLDRLSISEYIYDSSLLSELELNLEDKRDWLSNVPKSLNNAKETIQSVIEIVKGDTMIGNTTRLKIASLSNFLMTVDEKYAKEINDLRESYMYRRGGYQDLNLPTYREILSPLLSLIREDATETDRSLPEQYDLNDLPEDYKEIVARFMPTYSDLGATPPKNKTYDSIARSLYDPIEPDFFWYRLRLKNVYFSGLEEFQRLVVKQSDAAETVEFDGYSVSKATDYNTETDRNVNSTPRPPDFRPEERQQTELSIGKYTHGTYSTVDQDKEFDDLDTVTEENIKRQVEIMPDDRYSMTKCYPTFKVYFLADNDEEWLLFDDVFGYTSVLDINIYKSKYKSWIAQISLLNMSNNLDITREEEYLAKISKEPEDLPGFFGTLNTIDRYIVKRNYMYPEQGSGPLDDPQERSRRKQILKSRYDDLLKLEEDPYTDRRRDPGHMFLDIGTMIAIKMGYSSNPDELDTVFTGQIAEMQSGDVIRIIAQCYSTQLTVPLDNPGIKSALLPGLSGGADASSIIKEVLEKSPSTNFGVADRVAMAMRMGFGGSTIKYSIQGKDREFNAWNPVGFNPLDINLGFGSILRKFSEEYLKSLSSRKMENVFVPSASWLYRLFCNPKWVIANRPGLQVLHEVMRHYPGWVYAVRPYDLNGATLYFGKPNMPYYHTSWARLESNDEDVQRRHNSDINTSTLANDLYNKFVDSDLYIKFEEDLDTIESFMEGDVPDISIITAKLNASIEDLNSDVDYLVNANIFKDISLAYWTASERHLFIGKQYKAALQGIMTAISRQASTMFADITKIIATTKEPSEALAIIGRNRMAHHIAHKSRKDDNYSIHVITRTIYTKMLNIEYGTKWKSFISLFKQWLSESDLDTNTREALVSMAKKRPVYRSALHPRMRPFVLHHAAVTSWNLIQNDIVASADESYNMVVVEYPNNRQDPVEQTMSIGGHDVKTVYFAQDSEFGRSTIIFDKEIPPEHRKPKIVIENNATNKRLANNCAYGNLMEAMRPMYKGELYLIGNEKINPWDIVHVNDSYKNVRGPIEVDEVIHHFSKETGFITVVKPNLLVSTNDDNAWVYARSWQGIWGAIADGTTRRFYGVAGVATIAGPTLISSFSGYALPFGLLTSATTYFAVNDYMDYHFGTNVAGLLVGQGWTGTGKHPIDIMPLTKQGYPFIAGLNKTVNNAWAIRLHNSWERFKYDYERVGRNTARVKEVTDRS